MNVIFDLDGTLIDSKPRLYHLFQYLVPLSKFSYDEYWLRKANKQSHETILSNEFDYSKEEISEFVKEWMVLIESPEFLQFDINFSGVPEFLSILQEKANLYVCTARQHKAIVFEQLEQLKLLSFFKKILVTEQKKSKHDLIGENIPQLCNNDWILGDTGTDIQSGKLLNIKTCGVLSGFLNEESLSAYKPDRLLSSAIHF